MDDILDDLTPYFFFSRKQSNNFLPAGAMLKVSTIAISESFIEPSIEAVNRRKKDAISIRSSISARLKTESVSREQVQGLGLPYFEPMHFRGPTENGVNASLSWRSSATSHRSGLNCAGALKQSLSR